MIVNSNNHVVCFQHSTIPTTHVIPSACATVSPRVVEIRRPASVSTHLSVQLKCPITICVAQLAADYRVCWNGTRTAMQTTPSSHNKLMRH